MLRRATGSGALLGLAALGALALIAVGATAPRTSTTASRARLGALGARVAALEGRLAGCPSASAVRRRADVTRRGALHGAARLRPPALRSRVALLTRTVATLEAARRGCAAGRGPGSTAPPAMAGPGAPAAAAGPVGPLDLGPPAAGGSSAPGVPSPPAPPLAPVPPGTQSLEVDADPSGALRFTQSTLTASPGPLALTLVNAGPGFHTLAIKGNGISAGPTPGVTTGGSATLDVDLPPGTYTFYCTMPGHEAAGMSGTLTVG